MATKPKLIEAKKIDKKKSAQEEHTPGTVSSKLARRMGPDQADIFNNVSKELYSAIVLTINQDLENAFNEHIGTLEESLKEELGNRGLKEAANYFAPWILEVLEDVIHFGMKDVAGKLEELGNKAAAQFVQEGEEAGEEEPGEEDLFGVDEGVPLEEGEEVEEEEVAEPPEEAPAEGEEAPAEGEEGAMPEGLEELMGGGEGEAPASAIPGPRPRVWRHKSWRNRRVASSTKRYIMKIADLVHVAGGQEKLASDYGDVLSVQKRLQEVQNRILDRFARKYPEVQEAGPNEIFDWASRNFPFKG